MSKIIAKKIDDSAVPTPKLGKVAIYVSSVDDKLKIKYDDGSTQVVVFQTSGSVDRTYTQDFVGVATIVVAHNMGKIPTVAIMDTAGNQIQGDIQYDISDVNNVLTVTLSSPLSGTVICN